MINISYLFSKRMMHENVRKSWGYVRKSPVSFSYANVASRVMSEGVGACILSWGEHRAAIGDAAEVEDFLERIGAKLDKNSLNNGCEFPTSSQVLGEVLLPFFKKKYSEHLLIGIFHGDKDGSWMLGGQAKVQNHAERMAVSFWHSLMDVQ